MKYIALKSLLFALCLVMASCGSNNLERYKEIVLEQMAKELRTSVNSLYKDFNLSMDSISVHPITVSDSIELIKILSKKKDNYLEQIKYTKAKINSVFNFDRDSDRKYLNKLEEKLKAIDAGEFRIKEYESMKSDKVLGNLFVARISMIIPLMGREVDVLGYVFDAEGRCIEIIADGNMIDYFRNKPLN